MTEQERFQRHLPHLHAPSDTLTGGNENDRADA